MTARLVDDFRDVVLRVSMPFNQLLVTLGFLNRVQVLALDVFDQRQLGGGRFVDFAH
jgi:hypothetical protein